MRTTWRPLMVATTVLSMALALSGCGGGGGGGSTSGSGEMGVFVTDSFNDQFSQVWVDLFKIEASTDGMNWVTLFASDDPNGTPIDIASLSSAAQLLSTVTVPAANYTQVRVTLGDDVTLVPSNGGPPQTVQVTGGTDIGNGERQITLVATTPVASGQLSNLVVDFDLAAFQLVGGKLQPSIHQGDNSHFGPKQKFAELHGTVTNLTSSGFDLTLRNGHIVHVALTPDTVVFGEHGGQSMTLANGQQVEVRGTVDTTSHVVTADRIIVDNDSDSDNGMHFVGARGTVGTVDTTHSSFQLTLQDADHFAPNSGTITVVTDAHTVFHRGHHHSASFADISTGETVEVVGTLDLSTMTLTAKRVEIQ